MLEAHPFRLILGLEKTPFTRRATGSVDDEPEIKKKKRECSD